MYLAQNNKVLSSAIESRFNLLLILKRQKYEEFALERKQRRINPITLRKEPYITLSQRLPRQFFSFTFLIFSVLLVLGAVISGTFSDQALHSVDSLSRFVGQSASKLLKCCLYPNMIKLLFIDLQLKQSWLKTQ